MKIVAVLFFFILAFAENITLGNLYISEINDKVTHQNLIVQNNEIRVGNRVEIFDYSMVGSLELFYTKKFIFVNRAGMLVMSTLAHFGFNLTPEDGSTFKKRLSYQGEMMFQLCGDGLIRHMSGCEFASQIYITYEEIFHCW